MTLEIYYYIVLHIYTKTRDLWIYIKNDMPYSISTILRNENISSNKKRKIEYSAYKM